MSLLRRRPPVERRSLRSYTPERMLSEITLARTSGVSAMVGEASALTHSAVWAGTYLYADLISTLPFAAYREVDGAPVKLRTQPAIVASPSLSVSPIAWRTQLVVSLILRGNAFGLILTRDQFGFPTTIELQHPDAVRAEWDEQALTKRFRIDGADVDPTDVWHVAINQIPGSPFGLSMIEKARQAIYGGVAAATYSNEIFASGGHPTAILSTDAEIGADQARELQARFDQRLAERRGRAMVMQGMTYTPIQISPADSQFLDASRASVQDVARFLRLPVELIGGESGSSMTYSNVESRAVDLLRYSIDPVLVRIEEALTATLPRPQYVQANRAALLRMTTTDRYAAHSIALADGWRNVNEVRALEELPPIDGGNTYRTPSATAVPSQEPPDDDPEDDSDDGSDD